MSTITAYGYELVVDELPAKSLEYLLTYGLKQSIADSSANTQAEAKRAGKSEDEVQALVDAARKARVEAILAGTVGVRVAGATSGMTALERETRKVGMAEIEALAKSKGISLRAPAKSDEVTRAEFESKREALYQKFLPARGEAWKAEASRRLAATTSAIGDLEALLADFPAAPAEEDEEQVQA